MGDHLTEGPRIGARIIPDPETNAAMAAQARTLTDYCYLAALSQFPQEVLDRVGDEGLSGAAVQAAITGILLTPHARKVPTVNGLCFTVGVAIGEVLRQTQFLDMAPAMEAMGQGIAHALEHGRQAQGNA